MNNLSSMQLSSTLADDQVAIPTIENDQLVLVYSLELNAFSEAKLFRCVKFNRIRFVPSPSLFGTKLILYSNYNEDFAKFERNLYTKVNIENFQDTLQLKCCGSFNFYYVDERAPEELLGSFYIVVNPELEIGKGKHGNVSKLFLNSIQCQSVLSKCMDTIDTWKQKLKVSIESGYNFIHWTPIQELGSSRSAYSLANQLKINPDFKSKSMIDLNVDCKLEDVANVINWIRDEHGVLSLTDIVLNHTANESSWLKEHPESAYNCCNSPWLRPAFMLDLLLWHLTLDIENGRWVEQGVGAEVNTEHQLEQIRTIFTNEYLTLVNLETFYMCDVNQTIDFFEKYVHRKIANLINTNGIQNLIDNKQSFSPVKLIQSQSYKRFSSTVDFENAFHLVINKIEYKQTLNEIESVNDWINQASLEIKNCLHELNSQIKRDIDGHLRCAVDNVIKAARYERLSNDGPKIPFVTKKTPFATRYFLDCLDELECRDLAQVEDSLFDEKVSCFFMAHNGWVMGDDPLRNFAEKNSFVYLRRELICWGDSVKLRYGEKPEDSPFLWSFMKKYVKQMASTFNGLRLDNCHSTPIHVAQFMLDSARTVNPNLYLIAELFTSSEDIDNIFINKLGINSLIREAMSAGTSFELGRQVYRFGGDPVGSFSPDTIKSSSSDRKEFFMRPFVPSVAHAILFDQTHDNESPIVRRSPYDPLPSAALVSMTYSAIGSNRGYDELVPYHIHVVKEERPYSTWNDDDILGVNTSTGIISAKRILNELHQFLGSHGYSQAFIDQRDRDTVVVTRHNPLTHKSIILVSRTAFYPIDQSYSSSLKPLKVEGKFEKILFEIKMIGEPDVNFEKNKNFINGYRQFKSEVNSIVDASNSKMIQLEIFENPSFNLIHFKDFPPSSVLAFSVSLLDKQKKALATIQEKLKQYELKLSDINKIIEKLDLIDLNYILFRCNQEEIDESGSGVYVLSNGPLIYCGLAGVMFHLAKIRTHNDLGHPLCANLREGDWLPDYIVNRLSRRSSTKELSSWLQDAFFALSCIPRYLIPRYFDSLLLPLYTSLIDRVWSLSSDFVFHGNDFVKRLALGSVALVGSHSSSPLPPLSPKSIPTSLSHLEYFLQPTLAAGLPHFSSGYMRNWGRDTFISFKGLLLLTGRWDVAKVILLGFAGTLRHGLIPNLLDGGRNSRYNCRDSVWWWLQSIKDYVQSAPNGLELLNEEVYRLFPSDDSIYSNEDSSEKVYEPLHKTIQETLERHFQGIDFVERNHGKQIDAFMTAAGFHIKVGVDRDTGFVFGGNEWNCGTWMDKMGSSIKAGNIGHPATPRDGSAVEIVGLCKSVVSFLSDLHRNDLFPFKGVKKLDESGEILEFWTYEEWGRKIQNNFETFFYIGDNCNEQYVNRKKIYKDTFKATKPWMDYQLRPNFLVTMCKAPELFNPKHALEALEIVDNVLRGPLGMKTLDPNDWNYRADYDNSNDTDDYNIANGFNYHNGPEWLWLTGYYFIARLNFTLDYQRETGRTNRLIAKQFEHLLNSEWFGLPELTNSNGTHCGHSCTIQAWSHATMLELLHSLYLRQNVS